MGAAVGAHSIHEVWSYNRHNYTYDRRMRQLTELKLLEWRNIQADLWREDIRDIIGLTEKKMDSYLIVATLQLGMCCCFLTEGRMAKGTPPWLVHFHLLGLCGAFAYLLMSVWLAMHASIVASCSSVRLLTQFVRLPIPTWQQLQEMRTYGFSFENLEVGQMLRIPFIGSRASHIDASQLHAKQHKDPNSSEDNVQANGKTTIDPWSTEHLGSLRHLYELQEHPVSLRRHVILARRAARQYQCFDAFARVAMSFGTNQLLHTLGYYCLGYVALEEGAPWTAACVLAIVTAISVSLTQLDYSLTLKEQRISRILIMAGPTFAGLATGIFLFFGKSAEGWILLLLPMTYISHVLWLSFALVSCGFELQPSGSVLPMKFRAVLYLDVFGWITSDKRNQAPSAEAEDVKTEPGHSAEGLSILRRELRADVHLWQSEKVQRVLEEQDRARVSLAAGRFEALSTFRDSPASRLPTARDGELLRLSGYTDLGVEVSYLYDALTGETTVLHDSQASGDSRADPEKLQDWKQAHVRSITAFEDHLEQYIAGRKVVERKRQDQPCRASSSQPSISISVSSKNKERGFLGRSWGNACAALAPALVPWRPDPAEEERRAAEDGSYMRLPRSDSTSSLRELMRIEMHQNRQIGPSGEVSGMQPDAFNPASYSPHDVGHSDGEDEIITGHDKMKPGRWPAKVFSGATMLFIFLWFIGIFLPFSMFREFMTKPIVAEDILRARREKLLEEEADLGEQRSGGNPLGSSLQSIEDLVGDIVNVNWPSHSGFAPRSLSCDSKTCTKLVVSDDLAVYAGDLHPMLIGQAVGRLLEESPSVSFRRLPSCVPLEGQALKDVGIVCSGDNEQECHIVVLHARGLRLAQCPLSFHPVVRAEVTWTISSHWLRIRTKAKPEFVESVALNSHCLLRRQSEVEVESREEGMADATSGTVDKTSFRPGIVGCVVVGTTSGRIVQLRGAFTDRRRLVPDRTMEQRSMPVGRGTLHVFAPDFVTALRPATRTIQALDARSGTVAGEWRLPEGTRWVAFCGGGEWLLVLGMQNETVPVLLRFALPLVLRTSKILRLDAGADGPSSNSQLPEI